jgi:hypothetical protein
VVFRARESGAGADSELAVMRVRSDTHRAGR